MEVIQAKIFGPFALTVLRLNEMNHFKTFKTHESGLVIFFVNLKGFHRLPVTVNFDKMVSEYQDEPEH